VNDIWKDSGPSVEKAAQTMRILDRGEKAAVVSQVYNELEGN
jgi:hypothetical protein